MSVEHWTPFYWGEARFGSFASFLSLPFRSLQTNLLVLSYIHTFLFLLFLAVIPKVFVRNFSPIRYGIYFIGSFTLFLTNIYWTRDFTGPAFPSGISFGLAIIPLVLKVESDKYFIPITFCSGLLAAWVNPLVTLQFLPIYLVYLLFNRQRFRQLATIVIVDTFSSGLFIAYGVLHGAIRGFSLPSFKEFTYNNWYLPLVIAQVVTLVLIIHKQINGRLIKVEAQIFLATLLAWPSVLAISTLNHVKANLYYPRYFIPVVAVGMVVQIFSLVHFNTKSGKGELSHQTREKSQFNLVVKLIVAVILIGLNFQGMAVASRTTPISKPYLNTDLASLRMLDNPKFIAGDYWYSWPMKLFLHNSSEVPVLAYRKEEQKIFQKDHSTLLSSAFKNGATGLCFGPILDCEQQVSSVGNLATDNPFTSLFLQVLRKKVINGVDVSVVRIVSTDSLNRCWNGAELPTSIGKIVTSTMVAIPGNFGFVSYGPYVRLKPGKYEYTLEYSADGIQSTGTTDIANNGKQMLSATLLKGTEGKLFAIKKTFMQRTQGLSEFRVLSDGKSIVTVYTLCLSAAK
jgi:hypothetical protein